LGQYRGGGFVDIGDCSNIVGASGKSEQFLYFYHVCHDGDLLHRISLRLNAVQLFSIYKKAFKHLVRFGFRVFEVRCSQAAEIAAIF